MEIGKLQTKPLTGEADWPMWKYRIKFVLNYYANALEVIEGKILKPDEPAEGASQLILEHYKERLSTYNKANTCAMMVLTNSMTEETMQKIMRFDNARDVWLELHKLFGANSDNQLYNICLQFFQCKWTTNVSVAANLSKLKNLFSELNLGLERKQETKLPQMLLICKILDTLPSEFRAFKSGWLLLDEDKRTIDELTIQLCSREREYRDEKSKSDVTRRGIGARGIGTAAMEYMNTQSKRFCPSGPSRATGTGSDADVEILCGWICRHCTFHNLPDSETCEICSLPQGTASNIK